MTSSTIVPFKMAVVTLSLHNYWHENVSFINVPFKMVVSYCPSIIIGMKMTTFINVPFKMSVVVLSLPSCWPENYFIYHCPLGLKMTSFTIFPL